MDRILLVEDEIFIAEMIEEVLADRGRWIPLGLEQAKRFPRDANARAHDAIYRELSSG
jgi:hypothetical protein